MPAEYSNNIRLIISSYLIQNGAKLTKNKHQISPLDYLADAKMSDLLQKQCLAFEYEIEYNTTIVLFVNMIYL